MLRGWSIVHLCKVKRNGQKSTEVIFDVLGDNIKWNSQAKSISKTQNEEHEIPDGSSKTFDLVVGANGCFSKTRSLVESYPKLDRVTQASHF